MAEIIQFIKPISAADEFDQAVEAIKEAFAGDFGGYALAAWSFEGDEQSSSYYAGPHNVEELPMIVKDALEERIYDDDEDVDYVVELNDNNPD